MFIATLKAIGKEFFTISVGLSIVPFMFFFVRGYYNWSKQQKGESSNQHGDFISNHVQRSGFQQPSKHGWSDQETWVIWFTNMAEFEPNQTGKNTQLQQQTLKFQVVKLTIWSTGKKDITLESRPGAFKEMHLAVEGVKQRVETSENGPWKCLEHIGTAAIALCFLVHLYNLLLWLCNCCEKTAGVNWFQII